MRKIRNGVRVTPCLLYPDVLTSFLCETLFLIDRVRSFALYYRMLILEAHARNRRLRSAPSSAPIDVSVRAVHGQPSLSDDGQKNAPLRGISARIVFSCASDRRLTRPPGERCRMRIEWLLPTISTDFSPSRSGMHVKTRALRCCRPAATAPKQIPDLNNI